MLGELKPRFVPSSYRFAREIDGVAALGFGDEPNQAAFVYVAGNSLADAISPLIVHVARAPQKQELGATEGRPGSLLTLGDPPVQATYHDGMWAVGDGPDAQVSGDVVFHWDTTLVHSITLRRGEMVLAVRAPRQHVDLQALERVAASVPV